MDDIERRRLADPDTAAKIDEANAAAQARFQPRIVAAAIELELVRAGRIEAELSEAEQRTYAELKALYDDLLREHGEFLTADFLRRINLSLLE